VLDQYLSFVSTTTSYFLLPFLFISLTAYWHTFITIPQTLYYHWQSSNHGGSYSCLLAVQSTARGSTCKGSRWYFPSWMLYVPGKWKGTISLTLMIINTWLDLTWLDFFLSLIGLSSTSGCNVLPIRNPWRADTTSLWTWLLSTLGTCMWNLSRTVERCVYHCFGPEIPYRPLYVLCLLYYLWTGRLLLWTRWPGVLSLSLLYSICSDVCWMWNGYPETICRNRSQWIRGTLASGMLYD
jgi:hypothetical protein